MLLHVIIWSMQQRLSTSVGGNCSREVERRDPCAKQCTREASWWKGFNSPRILGGFVSITLDLRSQKGKPISLSRI
jgi:hypothetical protein